MNTGFQNRREQAQAEFQQRVGSAHSADLVRSLWAGLTTLRKLLLTRLHNDVEAYYGIDSILAPMTASETQREMCHAADEIEIYSLTVVLAEAAHSRYAHDDADWFREWLLRLRWGDEMNAMVAERMHLYDQYGDNDRRHMFASFVEQALPEATKAPLVIYRLYPRSVRVATALAFGDPLRAPRCVANRFLFCRSLPIATTATGCRWKMVTSARIAAILCGKSIGCPRPPDPQRGKRLSRQSCTCVSAMLSQLRCNPCR